VHRRRIRIGDRIVITRSAYSDVIPGAKGSVVRRHKGHFDVELTQIFYDAFHKSKVETRIMCFRRDEIELVSETASPITSEPPSYLEVGGT
jgi:hypothetical protein